MTQKHFVGAIDQGTTSTRFVIFDRQGRIVAWDQQEHRQIYPRPGWVEHDPIEIRDRTFSVVSKALNNAGLAPTDLAAIGITNQRETTLVWDAATSTPVYNAIVWQDTRTDHICRDLAQGDQDRFRTLVGLPLSTYFSGPKLKWLLDNVDGLKNAAEQGRLRFGTVDSWLAWWLTGRHITDVTNASRTMLMNLNSLTWDPEMYRMFGVHESMLPEIRPSSEVYGLTDPKKFFGAEIPVAGILGDQQAALFGQACFEPGQAKNTYGTGCFLLLNTGTRMAPSNSGLLTTVGYQIGNNLPVYALEGSIAIGGSLVQWVRDNLGLIEKSADIEHLARTVDDNGGIFFVPAFSGLFAPHWRSDARGVMVGLTHYTNRGHVARAVLEATAFQTREIFEAMIQDSGIALASLKVDGGMVVNELLMQFQADVLDVEVIRPKIAETTVLGAAYAAGLAVGFWENLDELKAKWSADRTWRPNMPPDRRKCLYADWKRAVDRSYGWVE